MRLISVRTSRKIIPVIIINISPRLRQPCIFLNTTSLFKRSERQNFITIKERSKIGVMFVTLKRTVWNPAIRLRSYYAERVIAVFGQVLLIKVKIVTGSKTHRMVVPLCTFRHLQSVPNSLLLFMEAAAHSHPVILKPQKRRCTGLNCYNHHKSGGCKISHNLQIALFSA